MTKVAYELRKGKPVMISSVLARALHSMGRGDYYQLPEQVADVVEEAEEAPKKKRGRKAKSKDSHVSEAGLDQ